MGYRRPPQVHSDLDDIWYYVATQERGFFFSRPIPILGRARDEDLRPGLRSFPVGEYVVIYRIIQDEDVLILRVLRGSRNIEALFGH
jgi:toxin ParE1/3/4